MNKHSFKTIWNKARGMLVAVSEVAILAGASTGGTAIAQIMADPSKPQGQQPIVLSAGNGVPVVNIQTPTAGGVSMNQFSQFNVNSNGAILNNGRQNTQTQLAGWIQANPYLATGSASVIVNQVNNNNPTLLNGYIEVAGQRASVIIANPSGISVNGGGFINAQSATLTTGTPNFNGNVITGYTVNQGSVQINGAGLDTSTTDYTALLARAAQINAGIWAKNLDVVTGANQINVTSVGATPTSIAPAPATGAVPVFAIDVASLGGMYAGKIYLMGTEAGVGMKNSGTIMGTNASLYAGAGDVTISVDGILSNKGTIQSDGATHITSGNLNNLGAARIYGNDVSISTGSLINTNETVAGINTAPVIASRGNMTIAAANILNTENATLMSLGEMNLTATNSIINGSALIQTGGNLTINAPDIQNNNHHYSVVQVPYGNSTSVTAYQSPTSVGGSGTIYTSNNVTQVGCDAGPCYNSNTGEYFENYIVYNYTTSQTKTQVATSAPAQILVGKNLNLAAGTLTNNASTIVVGGNLTGNLANLVNTPTLGNITTTDDGTSQYTNTWYHGKIGGHGRDWGSVNPYQNVTIQSINLGVSNSTFNTVPVSNPAVSNSALYKVVTNPTSNYLIATDPQFTNYQTWIGSDYLLAQLNLDPTTTQKRLGDAFYEQQLVQQQVSQLTGKAFLAGYQNNEDEYKALMTNGATYAQAHSLTVGLALTADQMAQLTSDVVWLVSQTVVLPNGATTTALVPQVYVAKTGGLTSGGSLISASNILLHLQNNLTNAGVIAGTNLLAIQAGNISSGGTLSGANVALAATNDINLTGGTVEATSNAILTAGGNITVASTTSTASGSTYSNTVLDRMAGIYVTNPNGTLVASAGNTLALNAANIQSAGSMALAGGNIIMGTVTTGNSSNQSYGGGNFVSQGSSTDVGSTLHAGGNLSASASNVLVGVAVNLSGAGTVALSGTNGVSLLAGQSASTSAMSMTSGSSGLLSSKTSTQGQAASSSAIGSTVTGGKVSITSSTGNVTLQAANINANNISLSAVNGTVALTSANQSRFYSTATTSGSTLTQGASGNGQSSQTAAMTQMNGNLTVQAKQVWVDTSTQPSEAWITQLQNDPALAGKVNWRQIDEAHKSWNYSQQGLSPAGAAILSLAVAYATAGVGAEIVGVSSATGASAMNVGFSNLAAQAAVSLANNAGDLSKVLSDLGQSQNVKSLVTSIATAGTITGLATSGWLPANIAGATAKSDFTDLFSKNLINSAAAAVVNSAVNGTSLEDSLKNNIVAALISAGAAQGANAIGDAASGTLTNSAKLSEFGRAVAHAIAGCVGGAAMAQSKDGCSAGAVGAVVGELAASYYNDGTGQPKTDTVQFAALMSGIAGAVVGGDARSVSLAAITGVNAALNNRMLHPDERALAADLAKSSNGKYTTAQIEEQLRLMGNKQTSEAANTLSVTTTPEQAANRITNDPTMPVSVSGSVVIERAGNANADIQAFIISSSNGKDPSVPGYTNYTLSVSLNVPASVGISTPSPTVTCANSDFNCKAGVGQPSNLPSLPEMSDATRNVIAEGASGLSRQAGVVGAAATVVGSQAGPYGKPAQGVAAGATVIGIGADAVEQLVRSNTGQTVTNLFGIWLQEAVNATALGKTVAPITNEAVEAWKNSGSTQSLQDWINLQIKKVGGTP